MIGHLQSLTQNVEGSEEIRVPPKERYIQGTLIQGASCFPPSLFIQGASPQVFCLKQMILCHPKLNCSAEPGSVGAAGRVTLNIQVLQKQ